MTPEKLANLIDLYGSALESWPEAGQRNEARALLERSDAARTLLRRARGLEACLRPPDERAVAAAGDDAACDRLIALTLQRARQTPQRPPPLGARLVAGLERLLAAAGDGWWRYGVPATLALALGIAVGHATLDRNPPLQLQPNVEGLIASIHAVEPFEL